MTDRLPSPQAISKDKVVSAFSSGKSVSSWTQELYLQVMQITRLCKLKGWSGHLSWMAGTQQLEFADGFLLLVWGIYYSWLLHGSYRLYVVCGVNYWCDDLINNGMLLHFQSETVVSSGGTSHSVMQITSVFWCCIELRSVH